MSGAFPSGAAAIISGEVVHKRLRPVPHALRYQVFALLIDLDRLDEAARDCALFGVNRFNAMSLHETDHLDSGEGSLATRARKLFASGGLATDGRRVFLLAYPRLFGFAFNPLSVFYLVESDGSIAGALFEVRNTFGERKCHVARPTMVRGDVYGLSLAKELYVSPFAPSEGRYVFRLAVGSRDVVVGVALSDGGGALIKTHFRGSPAPLTTRTGLMAVLRRPLMTSKVVAAINWEAAKLWLKGVPLTPRHRSPRFSVSCAPTVGSDQKDEHVRP